MKSYLPKSRHLAALSLLIGFAAFAFVVSNACAGTIYVSFDTNSAVNANKVATYDSVGGGGINSDFLSGLSNPYGLATDASAVYTSGIGSSNYKIRKHNATSGATIAPDPLKTGANAIDIKVSGGNIYAARYSSNAIAVYNASTGATVNGSLTGIPSGLNNPRGVVIDAVNNVMFVSQYGAGKVSKYNATTGAIINASFIQGLNGPAGLALDGAGNLFVAIAGGNTIGKYNATTGAGSASFITEPGGSSPLYLAVYGEDLFVTNYGSGKIGKFNLSTGSGTDSFITGLGKPVGIVVRDATPDTVSISGLTTKVIRLPNGASTALIATAEELKDKLNEIVGSNSFTVQTNAYDLSAGTGPAAGIVLGKGTDLNMSNELPNTDPIGGTPLPKKREDYQISTGNNNTYIFLAGTTDLAIRHAAYDLLTQLGCRWYFAGSRWEITPSNANLAWTTAPRLRTKSVSMGSQGTIAMKVYGDETPDFKQRHIFFSYFSSGAPSGWGQCGADLEKWIKGNRVGRGIVIDASHSYSAIATWATGAGQWSINYWSKINGVRVANTQIGVSNQPDPDEEAGSEIGVHNAVKNYVTSYFATNSLADSVSLEPNDGDKWCQCDACDLLQPVGPSGIDTITNRVVYLANQAATVLPANKYVAYYAYNSHSPPPTTGYDPASNPANPTPMTFTPDPRTYVLVSSAFTYGATIATRLAQWRNAGTQNLGVRDYLDVINWSFNVLGRSCPAANTTSLMNSLPVYHHYNADVYTGQATHGWGQAGLGYYLATKMLWSDKVDSAALKAEFLEKCFGPAAGPMTNFYNRIDAANYFFLSNDLLHRLYQELQDAYALVTGNTAVDQAIKTRIDDLTLWLHYNELWLELSTTSSPQTKTEELLNFVYNIRETNIVDSLGLWRVAKPYIYSDFTWPKTTPGGIDMDYSLTYEAGNTLKAPATYDPATFRTNGIANNKLLPEEPRSFSTDLVPSCRSATGYYRETVGNPAAHSQSLYKTPIYMVTDNNGNLPQLSISAGWSSMSKVPKGKLYRASDSTNALEDEVTISADKQPHTITFGAHGKGSYVFQYNDNAAGSKIDWPVTTGGSPTRASFTASPVEMCAFHYNADPTYTGGTYIYHKRYFYVPKGTKFVQFRAGLLAGLRFRTANGTVKTFSQQSIGSTPVYDKTITITPSPSAYQEIIIPVGNVLPPGVSTQYDDDQIWYLTADTVSTNLGVAYFLNTPGYFAKSPAELLIPREAYSNMKHPNLGASTAGGAMDIRGKTHFYLYTDGNADLPTLTVTNGNQAANWTLYREKDAIVAENVQKSGTVSANSSNATINLNSASSPYHAPAGAGSYHLIYDDHLSSGAGSRITWPAGSRVVVAANPQEKLASITPVSTSRRYFYVPKGVELIQISAETIGSGVKFHNAANAQKSFTQNGASMTQTTNETEGVTIDIPVGAGEDNQVWYVTDLNAQDFSIENIPGHLAVNKDELLLPQWLYYQNSGAW